jgi:hypothetical protein
MGFGVTNEASELRLKIRASMVPRKLLGDFAPVKTQLARISP